MCICINCKWVDRCITYHDVENNHGVDHIYIDIANQVAPTIEGDLCSRDFSINSIAFLFDKKCLVDPLNGLKDLEISFLRTYSENNLINDPLRILRCFRFVSELNFKVDLNLITFIKKNKGKLHLVAKERINYEIQKIVHGANALDAVLLIKKLIYLVLIIYLKILFFWI